MKDKVEAAKDDEICPVCNRGELTETKSCMLCGWTMILGFPMTMEAYAKLVDEDASNTRGNGE